MRYENVIVESIAAWNSTNGSIQREEAAITRGFPRGPGNRRANEKVEHTGSFHREKRAISNILRGKMRPLLRTYSRFGPIKEMPRTFRLLKQNLGFVYEFLLRLEKNSPRYRTWFVFYFSLFILKSFISQTCERDTWKSTTVIKCFDTWIRD